MRGTRGVLTRLGSACAIWVVGLFAWFVAAGYFLFRPSRVSQSLRFYGALAPERSLVGRLLWTWRQYQGFATLYSERLLLRSRPEAIRCTMEGMEHIDEAVSRQRGGVLLMSHMGNWEIAARILARRRYPLLLYMGARAGEKVEKEESTDLVYDGVKVLAVPEGEDLFTAGIEGLTALRQGQLVSLAGDGSWSPSHARVQVTMLGHVVSLPLAPHALALLAGAPLITFFALRTGRRRYHFVAHKGRSVVAGSRAERKEALRRSVQAYADQLEVMLREHPTQWYHFERFLEHEAHTTHT